VMSGRASG